MSEDRFGFGKDDAWEWIVDNDKLDDDYEGHLTSEECVDLLNQLNNENKYLKQFKNKVADVLEDNICNDYKIELLKEILGEGIRFK